MIGRVSGCVSVGGCVSGRLRGLAPGGVARVSVGGLLLAFARVAGRGARVIGRGMVCAYLAGRGPRENALWVVMRILLVSPRVWG